MANTELSIVHTLSLSPWQPEKLGITTPVFNIRKLGRPGRSGSPLIWITRDEAVIGTAHLPQSSPALGLWAEWTQWKSPPSAEPESPPQAPPAWEWRGWVDSEDQGFLEVTKIHANSWPWDNFPSNFHSLKLHFMKLLAKQTGRGGKTTNSPSIQRNNLLNWQGHRRSLFHATHERATRTFSHLGFSPCMAPALTQPLLHPRVCSKVGGKCLSFPSTIPLGKLSQGTNEMSHLTHEFTNGEGCPFPSLSKPVHV